MKLFRYDCLPFICWQNKRGKAGPAVEGLNSAVANSFGKQIVN